MVEAGSPLLVTAAILAARAARGGIWPLCRDAVPGLVFAGFNALREQRNLNVIEKAQHVAMLEAERVTATAKRAEEIRVADEAQKQSALDVEVQLSSTLDSRSELSSSIVGHDCQSCGARKKCGADF